MKLFFEILGYIGGFIMAIYSWPQIYKSITTKSTIDISLTSQLISLTGLCMIFSYCIYVAFALRLERVLK